MFLVVIIKQYILSPLLGWLRQEDRKLESHLSNSVNCSLKIKITKCQDVAQ